MVCLKHSTSHNNITVFVILAVMLFRPFVTRLSSDGIWSCAASIDIQDYSPDANQSIKYLPGLETVMSRDHIVGETADNTPAFLSAFPALPVESAAYYLLCLSCIHFLHKFFSFQIVS